MGWSILDEFKVYIKVDDDFFFYGYGDMTYVMELLNNYLLINDMYGYDNKEFKIERVKR